MRKQIVIIYFFIIGCINAPHSNIYDPENPHKARITGSVREPDGTPLENAVIALFQGEKMIQSDTSDGEGVFMLDDITPGIYKIEATALYYTMVEISPETLWAGTKLNGFDIYFSTLHFDNEAAGTASAYGFETITGDWNIMNDNGQTTEHSLPNVYNGKNKNTEKALVLYSMDFGDFKFKTKLKILNSTEENWEAGIVFRYRNEENHYCLKISSDTLSLVKKENGIQKAVAVVECATPKEKWFSLGVECYFTVIKTYLNDQLMFYEVNNVLTSGRAGLTVMNKIPTQTTSVNFDDVTITTD
ncbi:MAG TPA: carboxypeptidase regulatory-like domain-containing protein [candidate division WOR-3 bacterium]|uniref:Carboxypeptidase regulatory-like domain-containing protein n=1 Tax=candidate division WOR-3 bacterium TaxID=2052148 RepID=A0A9C9EMC8_UNCW3|nr:carboxypeptidase regulatory-like domain-containing protein [candidate division WOR-3 bacterium]